MIRNGEVPLSPYMDLYDIVVPQDHELRKIKKLVDFSFVDEMLRKTYTIDNGMPAILQFRCSSICFLKGSMHMSKARIYDQLTSEYGEDFTDEEAQYAIDNLVADYNENALLTAKNYQEVMNMSKAAIYDQLVSQYGEQFTPEEAQYAVEHLDD